MHELKHGGTLMPITSTNIVRFDQCLHFLTRKELFLPEWLKSARISFVSEMLGLGLYIAGLVHMLQYH